MGLNLLSCLKNIFPVCKHVEKKDRLSSLPDYIIHKILSFIGIKDAIRMSVLSSRWRYIWASMPHLNFFNRDFTNIRDPSKFISAVLLRRNNLIGLLSIYLEYYPLCHELKFPASVLISKSLKHLTLKGITFWEHTSTSTWELLALTTLRLEYEILYNDNADECIDLFSKCVNLKNLSIECRSILMEGSKGFRISHPRLSDLSIRDYSGNLFGTDHPLQFSTDTLRSLEKLDLCIVLPHCHGDASNMFGLLQHLHGVKFLQLNFELVEFLSSSMKLISPPPSRFAQLKSLKIFCALEQCPLSTEIKNYFLDTSPNASFTMIPRKMEYFMNCYT